MVPPPTRYPYLSQKKQLEHLLGLESGSTLQQERIDASSDRRRSEGGYRRYSHITHGNADIHVKFSDACYKLHYLVFNGGVVSNVTSKYC